MRKNYEILIVCKSVLAQPLLEIIFRICWGTPQKSMCLNQGCKNAITSELQTLSGLGLHG